MNFGSYHWDFSVIIYHRGPLLVGKDDTNSHTKHFQMKKQNCSFLFTYSILAFEIVGNTGSCHLNQYLKEKKITSSCHSFQWKPLSWADRQLSWTISTLCCFILKHSYCLFLLRYTLKTQLRWHLNSVPWCHHLYFIISCWMGNWCTDWQNF